MYILSKGEYFYKIECITYLGKVFCFAKIWKHEGSKAEKLKSKRTYVHNAAVNIVKEAAGYPKDQFGAIQEAFYFQNGATE